MVPRGNYGRPTHLGSTLERENSIQPEIPKAFGKQDETAPWTQTKIDEMVIYRDNASKINVWRNDLESLQ